MATDSRSLSASTLATSREVPQGTRPRYLNRIDVRAAVVIAALFNAIVGVAFTFTGWLIILVAAQRGLLDQINEVTSDLGTGHPAHLSAFRLCLVWTLIVACWAVAVTVVAGLAAFILNRVLEAMGGIELDLRDEPPPKTDVEGIVRGFGASIRSRWGALVESRAELAAQRARRS